MEKSNRDRPNPKRLKNLSPRNGSMFSGQDSARKPKVFIKTFGCQMNFLDSEVVVGILTREGFELVDSPGKADVILFNGCSVRQHAEERVWGGLGALKKIKAKNRNIKIGVLGCIAEAHKDEILRRFPQVDFVVGPRRIKEIDIFLDEVINKGNRLVVLGQGSDFLRDESFALRKNKTSAFVRIMVGCDNFCSYCIVPYLRGRERSRSSRHVLDEITTLVAKGHEEVILLGQNVNSYGKALEEVIDFADLLKQTAKIDGLKRIRFMTSHPKDISTKLIEVIAGEKKIVRHIHLPLQSGSDRILRLMNRGYSSGDYLTLVTKLRQAIPGLILSTDVIVGFPKETMDDFKKTYNLVKEIGFDNAFIFKYSPRLPAASVKMKDDVPLCEKEERNQMLLALCHKEVRK